MVDALLGVASCVMEDEEELELYVVTYKTTGSSVRRCEFCKSTDTPAWRRGPAGKGSLCNACGIKWRLKKKIKKSDSSPWNDIGKRSHVNMKRTAGRPAKKLPKVIHHFVESRMRCQSCHFPTDPQDFNDPVFDLRCRICVEKSLAAENDDPRSNPLSDPESPSSPGPEALVARLLNVVAHGLVDVTELNQVNDELQTMKSELLLKQTKDRHEHQLADFRAKINQDLADLKSNALHKIREANRLRAEQLRSFFESMVSSLDLALVEQQTPSPLL